MRHFASPSFWTAYEALPAAIRQLADRNFELLKVDPRHPSLHFQQVGRYRLLWFWIGTHAAYDKLTSRA